MLKMVCRQGCRVPFCQPVCPTGAIIVQTQTVYVESDDCIECGTCRYMCRSLGFDHGLERKLLEWLGSKAVPSKPAPEQ